LKWESVRERYPDSWILFEALEARSEEGKRRVDKVSVLDCYENSGEAIKAYKDLHKKEPNRELYVVHTKKEKLDIIERNWLGVRI
jgi:hypothetical protein